MSQQQCAKWPGSEAMTQTQLAIHTGGLVRLEDVASKLVVATRLHSTGRLLGSTRLSKLKSRNKVDQDESRIRLGAARALKKEMQRV